MEFKTSIIEALSNKNNRIISSTMLDKVKKDVEDQKKRIERFNQLVILGVQNKKYNLSIR